MDVRAPRKVIPADPTLRRVTIVALVALALVGAIGIVFTASFTDHLRDLAERSPEQAARSAARAFKTITALMAVMPGTVGLYLAYVAVRAWQTGEFPPPGTRVLRDTVVTVGPRSRVWAIVGLVVAVLLLAGGIAVVVWSWRLAEHVVQASAGTVGY